LVNIVQDIKNKLIVYNLHSEINDFLEILKNFSILESEDLNVIVHKFNNSLEKFIKNYQFNDTLEMLSDAKDFYIQFFTFIQIFNNIIKQTEEKPELKENIKILELEFFEHQDINDLSIKFSALSIIYSELCGLFNISEKEFKLDIIKVETGSLLNLLIGHHDIIKELISLIKSFSTFLYETFSKTHKIEKLGKNIDTIEKTLKLCSSLEKHGIDTTKMKENVQKSSITVSEKLFELLSGEPKIAVQNEIIELKNSNRQLYIDEGKKLLLTEGLNKTIS
jgi:hypothetical protein